MEQRKVLRTRFQLPAESRDGAGLREVLGRDRMASSDATGDWLRRIGVNGGLEGLGKVNGRCLKRALKYVKLKCYTLDIDATGIEAERREAKRTYKGFRQLHADGRILGC